MSFKPLWTPDLEQAIDALTNNNCPLYNKKLSDRIKEKYGTLEQFKKSDVFLTARNEKKIKDEELIELGFYKFQYIYTVYIYELGNGKHLSLSNFGTSNESLFICDGENIQNPKDIICIHNYNYHGYMTLSKLKLIVALLTNNPFNI